MPVLCSLSGGIRGGYMKTIDYSAWRFWFDVLQLIGICIIGIYSWWISKERVTNKRFKEHHARLTALEGHIQNSPSPKQFKDLADKFELIHGDMREIKGQLTGINRAVDLMNEYLINNGGK